MPRINVNSNEVGRGGVGFGRLGGSSFFKATKAPDITRLVIYDGLSASDPVYKEIEFEVSDQAPSKGTTIPIGFRSSNGEQEYDNIRTDSKLIEDFSACDGVNTYFDQCYTGYDGSVSPSDRFSVVTSGEDCILIADSSFSDSQSIMSSVGYGLQNYPYWGESIYADVYVSSGEDAGINLGGTAQNPSFEASSAGSSSEYSISGDWVVNKTVSDPILQGDQLWRIDFSL